jgi:mono/diheme cytochrome c family protein
MLKRLLILGTVFWVIAMVAVGGAQTTNLNPGWKLPANAAAEKNPLPANETTIAAGLRVFSTKCQRCHGPKGEGDGVDADESLKKEMDLTRADRAAANPDGIIFHKIQVGKSEPRMPAFAEQLSKDQSWAVVTYVQTLRKKAGAPAR